MVFLLPESLSGHKRAEAGVLRALKSTAGLLRQREYMLYTVLFWATFSSMFAYIAASPFIFQRIGGFSEIGFSLTFMINSASLVVASVLGPRLVGVWGERGLATRAVAVMVLSVVWIAMTVAFLGTAAWAMEVGFLVLVAGTGLLLPRLSALAISKVGPHTGAASAVLGAGQYVLSSIIAPLTGIGGGTSAVPMVVLMAVLAAGQLVLIRLWRHRS